ncbi:hypothetical protein GF314_02230, partial [bacterium]|nr:hypothetical protein [bacterium]
VYICSECIKLCNDILEGELLDEAALAPPKFPKPKEIRDRLYEILAKHTGQPVEKIAEDSDRDFFMAADEALEYGLVDKVIESREEIEKKK